MILQNGYSNEIVRVISINDITHHYYNNSVYLIYIFTLLFTFFYHLSPSVAS